MENYSNSVSFDGDPQQALSAASTVLIANRFSVVKQESHQIDFSGPGMNSTKQDPLVGASEVIVHVKDGRLTVVAKLGGVASMQRFVSRFPLWLGLGMGTGFGLITVAVLAGVQLFAGNIGARFPMIWFYPLLALLIPLLAVSPWFFLAPWIGGKLEKRTTAALDALLVSVGQVAHAA
ncbi:MAG: hypothetical protein K0U86_04560 [Planctomycetes bacterium]|nr:hypothetical protein [Planctomycetota bacterium]MCH9724160.1 hypothetical protein [Planctomycetota bacterium]MCH9777943.1 hypothetical protein [Planctomycetota bacterium]MCH9789310.1 hypothetical protein [Planctomycetota bacterium]MDF1742934.1 hypothetical protein [Gimesia sp.]